MNVIRRFGGLVTTVTAALLGACAAAPAAPRSPVTLRYAENDYLVQEIAADASGSYAVYHMGELTYLTRRLELDGDGLAALAQLAERQNFYALPADLDDLPDDRGSGCDPGIDPDPHCERLERIVVTSDCGPDSRLRIGDGRRRHEVHWRCGNGAPAVIQPLLEAIRTLFAAHPTVVNAPPPRRWRR